MDIFCSLGSVSTLSGLSSSPVPQPGMSFAFSEESGTPEQVYMSSLPVWSLEQADPSEEEEIQPLAGMNSLEIEDDAQVPRRRRAHLFWVLPLVVIVACWMITDQCACGPAVFEHRPRSRVMVGYDPSEALGALRNNVTFRDVDGTIKDPLVIFADHGFQWARIRIMVDPSGTYGLFQDVSYVKKMARQIHDLGMKFLLDFHYSHWWADPANQWIPNRWKATQGDPNDVPVLVLEEKVYQHTLKIMQELQDQGTVPDAVQIGNEVNTGFLWKTAQVSIDNEQNWENFTKITNSAVRAISNLELLPDQDRPKIVMHLAAGGDAVFTQKWLESFVRAGGQFDVIGLSYYPMWHGSLRDLKSNLDNLAEVFPDKEAWVVETAYYWTQSDNANLPFPQTPDGQVEYLEAVRSVLDDYGRNTVAFYWGSHWTQPEKWMHPAPETWADAARRSLFDDTAKALKGIDALFPHRSTRASNHMCRCYW